jgi:galactokinase
MTGIGSGGAGLEDFLAGARAAFSRALGAGTAPRAFFAPGRVNLVGEHVDHSGGPSLALAVDRGTLVLGRPRADRRLRLHGERPGETVELPLDDLPAVRRGGWEDYALGVLRGLGPSGLPGLDLWVGGDLPVGVGLSSSASFTVAVALAAGTLAGRPPRADALVELALAAERDFVGVPCGRLDPVSVVHGRAGRALWIDAAAARHEAVPLDLGDAELLVVESGVERALVAGAYARRVAECRAAHEALREHAPDAEHLAQVPAEVLRERAPSLEPTLARRARHVIEESARASEARARLAAGDLLGLGRLLVGSHASLREAMEVSVPVLDDLVDAALAVPGVHGARLLGAGFGGSVLVLAERGAAPELAARAARVAGPGPGAGRVHRLRAGDGPRELGPPDGAGDRGCA